MFTTIRQGGIKASAAPPLPLSGNSRIQYLPELDSLRTFAVIMTLLAHFAPVDIPYMWYGVPIFFTISGFLITTILLNTANSAPEGSRLPIIKNFMVRRALRLFPVYYLFIIFFWLGKKYLSLYLWKDDFTVYFFTYTPNLLVYKSGSGYMGCFAHLWSLGVEEQFYLFWPWVLLFPPPKFRVPLIIGMILFSLTYICFHSSREWINALPFAEFHTLGAGALLAIFYVKGGKIIGWLKNNRHLLFLCTFVQLMLVLIFFRKTPAFFLYREIALCLCTFSVVLVSIFGWKGFMGYITRNRAVQYLGTISYGIYLYHMPVPFVYRIIMDRVAPAFHLQPLLFTFLCFGITILIAALSYKYIETPLLKLKAYFA